MPRKHDDDDDDVRPRAKREKERPLTPTLVWSGLLSVCWGGVFAIYALANLYQTIRILIALNSDEAVGRDAEFTRGGIITLVCLYAVLLIFTLIGFFGAVNLLRRSSMGGMLTIWCPGAAALIGLGGSITLFIMVRGSSIFMMYLLGYMLTFVLSLALSIFNGFVMNDRKNTKALK
jgi:hypothetical protein